MIAEDVHEIVELYEEGWGAIHIARYMCFSVQRVERVLLGKTHKSITGGRIMRGKRPGAVLACYAGHKVNDLDEVLE